MIYITTGNVDFFNLLQQNEHSANVIANVLSISPKEVSVTKDSKELSKGFIREKETWVLDNCPDHYQHPDNFLKSIKLSASDINGTNFYVVTTFSHVYFNAWRAQTRHRVIRNVKAVRANYTAKKKIWEVGMFDIDSSGLPDAEFWVGSFEAQFEILDKMVGKSATPT